MHSMMASPPGRKILSQATPVHTKYFPALDSIRGIAVLLVIVFHTLPQSLPGGFLGVDIFFVLSGYLITLLLLEEKSQRESINLGYFYIRRFLRLTPAFTLLVCVYLTVSLWLNSSWNDIAPRIKEALIAFFYMANWARAFDWYPSTVYLSHTWSLAIEEQFYLLWPTCFILLTSKFRRPEHAIIIGAACLLIVTWAWRYWLLENNASYMRIYNGLDTRADALMAGAITAAISRLAGTGHYYRQWAIRLTTVVCIVCLAILVMHASWMSRALYIWQLPVTHLACSVLTYNLSKVEPFYFSPIFTFKPLIFLGRISYGLYLWHIPALLILLSLDLTGMRLMLATFLSTLACAVTSFYCVERPALRLKARFR